MDVSHVHRAEGLAQATGNEMKKEKNNMTNIADFAVTLEMKEEPNASLLKKAEAFSDFKKAADLLRNGDVPWSREVSYKEQEVLTDISSRMGVDLLKARGEIVAATGNLPESLRSSNDLASKAAKSPKVSVPELASVAEKLGFLMIPMEYLDPRSYKDESYEMQRAITDFPKIEEIGFQPYVVCPIGYYNLSQHIEAESDLPIRAPSMANQAFMALSMSVPMFRSMREDTREVSHRVDRMEKRVSRVEAEIEGLSRRLNEIAAQVQAQQIALIRQREETAEALRRRESSTWIAWEPFCFAIPGDKTIFDATWAVAGPCWGPDFDAMVTEALGLRVQEGRRKMLLEGPFGSGGNPPPPPAKKYWKDDPAAKYLKSEPSRALVPVTCNSCGGEGEVKIDAYRWGHCLACMGSGEVEVWK